MDTKITATFTIEGAREGITATQTINISQVAYDYWVSNECPSFGQKHDWSRMTKHQKIVKHLNQIKELLHASQFTFEVLPD